MARKLADSGKIVIFISHRMAEIKDGCDNITILRNGTYAGDLPVNDNLDMDEVISMMLGRKMSSYFPQITDCSMDEDALELKDVRYRNILNGVNLKVKKGEVVGIGGLAGQGQAELLQALYGIYPVTGEIYFQGKKIHIKNPKDAINKKIALVPEERAIQGLFLQLGIDFNISITSVNKMSKGPIISKKKENSIVSKYMKALAVKAPTPQTPVQDLSGGNQQKVVMAKIISCEPELLLLHDITRGVDVGTKKEMFTLVREFAKEGNAVIFFSTDVEELVNVCDRVLVMYDGKIRANLKLETLTKEQIIGASIGANQIGGEGNEEK